MDLWGTKIEGKEPNYNKVVSENLTYHIDIISFQGRDLAIVIYTDESYLKIDNYGVSVIANNHNVTRIIFRGYDKFWHFWTSEARAEEITFIDTKITNINTALRILRIQNR